MTSTGRLAFATTEWVVDRVHGDTTRLGADALPAVASGLTDRRQFVLGVPDRAERGAKSIGTRRISVEGRRSVA